MRIIDTHCDALYKLQQSRRNSSKFPLRFKDSPELNTNLEYLKKGNIQVQFFAIFIMPDVPSNEKWQHALEQIDIFYQEILAGNPEMRHIKQWSDLNDLQEGEIGAVLTLEGADAFGNDFMKLRLLYQLGVLSIGLTWNNANLCADGIEEPRGAGLTSFGHEVVGLNNIQGVLTDVSHLSIKAFWDVMEVAKYPIASHSNTFALCSHPRNLSDEQLRVMFEKEAMVHVVFYPPFINHDKNHATITDLIKHIDYLCGIGGVHHIGFGSDFDGMGYFVTGLENASMYQNLINELLKHFKEKEVKGFASQNFLRYIRKISTS
ncbi:dipeptidase [Ornithinibacillus scapharcae]|uniref:dipeptidase n=1 Tax=Ornithinibacillus scapharcae TaxID=1147159 RepID=UPI000225AD65|nr:dipeptidase [Ornithinibacillus scapharcae]